MTFNPDLKIFYYITEMSPAFVVRAPGRVNLLGEHTDYNGLPVMPMAIHQHIIITVRPRDDHQVNVWAMEYQLEKAEFTLESPLPKHPQGHWSNYVKAGMQAVLNEFSSGKKLKGCDILITGDIPQGVGLSSSSAIVTGSAVALLHTNGISYDSIELADKMAKAEHYVGTRGGGMDQAVCLLGEKDHLLKIDFFPLHVQPVSLPRNVTFVICNSLVRAKKTENALQGYNKRAVECRFASMLLKKYLEQNNQPSDFERLGDLLHSPWNYSYKKLASLADKALKDSYTYSDLCSEFGDENPIKTMLEDYSFIDEKDYTNMNFYCGKRYRHIITDGWRVERSVDLLKQGDVEGFGQLMYEGHTSARDDFEISCPELNRLADISRKNGALGARLTGAGFGGCTVNLVRRRKAERLVKNVMAEFYSEKDSSARNAVFVSEPSNGVDIIDLKEN